MYKYLYLIFEYIFSHSDLNGQYPISLHPPKGSNWTMNDFLIVCVEKNEENKEKWSQPLIIDQRVKIGNKHF